MANSYTQAVLRTTDLAEAPRAAGRLLELADTTDLEVDFEAWVSTPGELERLSGVMPDAEWFSDGTDRAKARRKVAKIHARVGDRRRDLLHKLTIRLVRENQTLVIEDLTVRNMVKNHTLARAISDASWSAFRSMLEYKAAWYGREVIVVDRFFPSSKLCSVCGAVQERMPLDVRFWTCDCGTTHDRDVNAARNLLAAGLAVSVCGAGVRPQRSSPGGQSATKQKTPRREP